MPTPLELLLDPVSLAVFFIYATLIVLEALFPARPLPRVPGWRIRGLTAFLCFFFISSYLPLVWRGALSKVSLLDLSSLSNWTGALIGLLVYEAGVYVWHRAMHNVRALWLGFHQMHHSAERLDTWGAFWFSPLDMLGWTLLSSVCLGVIIVIPPQSAVWVLYATTLLGVFQHSNIRTPRWLGYFVQRPESHSMHHQRGLHANNYSDLPVFDILLGTFRNPSRFTKHQGFWVGASSKVRSMLFFRDVSIAPRCPHSLDQATMTDDVQSVEEGI
jgi:sterol desaturase/sphingolipid hydroxylase (fatty acid hydroxylase superfamily)